MLIVSKDGHIKEDVRVPVKIWLKDINDIEPGCLGQAVHLANLPFSHHHIALMPDTHEGYGMPIGGVIAAEDVVIPNAVGVDVGCGMIFLETDIPAKLIRETMTGSGTLAQLLSGSIMRNIPVGFDRHSKKQECLALDKFSNLHVTNEEIELIPELESGYYQIGTLGGGNHFIELQENEKGNLCFMIHSGSRNFGYRIADFFNKKAEELNKKWWVNNAVEWELAFLPVDHPMGQAYLRWHNLALEFAAENRERMMDVLKDIVLKAVEKFTGFVGTEIIRVNCHHNYVARETHFKKDVWVHRKGAIRARAGEVGIIPGAMGVHSYIVEGLGNPESFESCSHGAGRKMGRNEARKTFRVNEVMDFFKAHEIVFGKKNKEDSADEFFAAYKNLDDVMENQKDLVKPVQRLINAGLVIKG